VSYQPLFTITPALLARVEQIAALRERILAATVEVPWIPALQKDTRTRNTHSSTASKAIRLRWNRSAPWRKVGRFRRRRPRQARSSQLFRRTAIRREECG